MTNFLICTVLPSAASRVYRTHKFDDFLNLIQLFPITPYSVLIRIKVVRNYVMNNLSSMINSLGCTVFTPRVSEVGKIQPFRRKNRFFVNLRGS